jgi:hypothetical protein
MTDHNVSTSNCALAVRPLGKLGLRTTRCRPIGSLGPGAAVDATERSHGTPPSRRSFVADRPGARAGGHSEH